MRAFWLPGKAPEAKVILEKPDMSTTCPASGGKLKLKARPLEPGGGVASWVQQRGTGQQDISSGWGGAQRRRQAVARWLLNSE